jgi:hypothetical protein
MVMQSISATDLTSETCDCRGKFYASAPSANPRVSPDAPRTREAGRPASPKFLAGNDVMGVVPPRNDRRPVGG